METAASTVTRTRARTRVASVPAGSRPLLLIVEADDRARKGCAAALSRAGYRILEAKSEFEALVKACCHRPALVLLGIPLAAAGIVVADTIALFAGCPETTSIPVLHLSSSKALLADVRRVLA
jgi:CheY-like chemotaxis protein